MKKAEKDKLKSFNLEDEKSKLSSIKSFAVPADYFTSSQNEMLGKINALGEKENSVLPNPFLTPENYFEKLPNSIQQTITNQRQHQNLPGWIEILLRPQVGIAFASLLLLLWFGVKTRQPKIIESGSSEITVEYLVAADYLRDLDETTIIEMLLAEDVSSASPSSDTYIDYLLDNDIEISQIETDL